MAFRLLMRRAAGVYNQDFDPRVLYAAFLKPGWMSHYLWSLKLSITTSGKVNQELIFVNASYLQASELRAMRCVDIFNREQVDLHEEYFIHAWEMQLWQVGRLQGVWEVAGTGPLRLGRVPRAMAGALRAYTKVCIAPSSVPGNSSEQEPPIAPSQAPERARKRQKTTLGN